MEVAGRDPGFGKAHTAPSLVTLAPFSHIPLQTLRRLSSSFTQQSRQLSSVRQLAWVSLQGRLVNAEEASSALTIKGNLSPEQAIAWELFSPIQRFLILAVIGVSVADSKKNRQIWNLKKSVELRDQVLSTMQEKLDNLCQQVNNIKDHSSAEVSMPCTNNVEIPTNETFGSDKIKFVDCGCWLCDEHSSMFNGSMGKSVAKVSSGNEVLQYKTTFSIEAEQEERRMSDLSDWAPSVTSATDIQTDTLAVGQDMHNFKRECEEDDTTIEELTSLLNSSELAGSKRIAELEDIIRRKNAIITKLRKEMVVLEQKVVHLTRLRRPSFSASDSYNAHILHMTDNLLFDMDSTTSPSSSDSDIVPTNRPKVPVSKIDEVPVQKNSYHSTRNQKITQAKGSSFQTEQLSKSKSASPLKEICTNRKSNIVSSSFSRQKQLPARGNLKKNRRLSLTGSNTASPQKKWM
ncbi:Inactive rhomboid protein [Quillaja saponaria]|uniref:Inactive rhomboid protein n=1 Tax=Quillaja saponaria TaxID=32244 RepID=A0AAD7KXC0_QUISA|nr:Inactive rhomboid protein [Quillaja saponaria]